MQFSGQNAYLVLARDPSSGAGFVRIVRGGQDALALWTASTRLSPVFGVSKAGYTSPVAFDFAGRWHFVFVGPVHPENVPPLASSKGHIWLSIGLFNIVAATVSEMESSELVDWAKQNQLPFECWQVENGCVLGTSTWHASPEEDGWRDILAEI